MYPMDDIEPTNGFIVLVAKTLLEHEVPHKAILATIEAMEGTITYAREQRKKRDEEMRPLMKQFFGDNGNT